MFGYLLGNLEIMTKEEKSLYKAQYCGLCQSLAKHYGATGRLTLTYDLTFVNMILSDVNDSQIEQYHTTCPVHLLKKQRIITNKYNDYCADMNIYLTYYKYLDDIYDDNSKKAKKKSTKLLPYLKQIEEKYPTVTSTIKDQLAYISKIEKDNILDPDLGSNGFGVIMGVLLSDQSENCKEDLYSFGYHLGRFIYMIDAIIDLKDDIIKQRYNPLVRLENTNYEDILMMIMEDADTSYQRLTLKQNKSIIDNIVYSGIWSKYHLAKKKGKLK
jgi:hypothetical protein